MAVVEGCGAALVHGRILRLRYTPLRTLMPLHRPPAFQHARQRHLIGVFQIAADGQTACQAA